MRAGTKNAQLYISTWVRVYGGEWIAFFKKRFRGTKRFGAFCRIERGGKIYEWCGFIGKKFLNVVETECGPSMGESESETSVRHGCASLQSRNGVADDATADRPRGTGCDGGERGRSEWYISSSAIATTVPVHACPATESLFNFIRGATRWLLSLPQPVVFFNIIAVVTSG